eukprot:TRINITY_DN8763_c0_g1_i1.p1 TRINITY_DN8763_c0_g1~~TRINITY_DN8763_c0_g1_i1.p1  ORF type:complete len:182 (-),score=31.38 TRINITY_DN8763_c0_g1_i1:185-730(-)
MLRPSLRCLAKFAYQGHKPVVHESAWVAPTAAVIGRVTCEAESNIWFGAVLRGDNEDIVIGPRANVQDNAVIHVDPSAPCHIGKDVTIGHLAMLHGCTIGENSLVGIGAVILNNAKIGKNCLIAANALIGENKVIPDNSVVMGAPGKVVKEVTPEMAEGFRANADSYVKKIQTYRDLELLD